MSQKSGNAPNREIRGVADSDEPENDQMNFRPRKLTGMTPTAKEVLILSHSNLQPDSNQANSPPWYASTGHDSPGPWLNHTRRHQSQSDMAEWSVERIISWSPRRTYHVIVKLCSNNPGKMWNRMLRWKKATNRKAFGGYWYNKPNDKLMAGIVLFEKR
jgi:hypothetical protein